MNIKKSPAKRAIPKLKEMKPGSVFVQLDSANDKAVYMVMEYEHLDQGHAQIRPCLDLDKGKKVLFKEETFVIVCRATLELEVPLG